MEISKTRELISEGVCIVTFKKVDGSERTIRGTTNALILEQILGQNIVDTVNLEPQENRLVKIYDLDQNGWRSFIYDNLIELEVV